MSWAGLYASDEDLAGAAIGEFSTLVGRQVVVSRSDGAVAAESPWTLVSPAIDPAIGLEAGHVVEVSHDTRKGLDQSYGIVSISTGEAVLRMVGEPTGFGAGIASGEAVVGLRFRVATARGVIRRSCALIDSELRGKQGSVAAEVLRAAAVYKSLCEMYYAQARSVQDQDESPKWAGKGRHYCAQFNAIMDDLKRSLGLIAVDEETPGLIDDGDAGPLMGLPGVDPAATSPFGAEGRGNATWGGWPIR